MPLFDKIDDLAKAINAKEAIHNLTWALNGEGTHSTQTVKAVWEALSLARNKADVERILLDLGEKLMSGAKLFD